MEIINIYALSIESFSEWVWKMEIENSRQAQRFLYEWNKHNDVVDIY